jgi:hypothetical protein
MDNVEPRPWPPTEEDIDNWIAMFDRGCPAPDLGMSTQRQEQVIWRCVVGYLLLATTIVIWVSLFL